MPIEIVHDLLYYYLFKKGFTIFYFTTILLLYIMYILYTRANTTIWPAILWISIDILAFILNSDNQTIESFTMIVVNFVLAYGTFKLASYLKHSMWELVVLAIGIALLFISALRF